MAFIYLPKTESPSIHLLFSVKALSLLLYIVAQAIAFLSVLAYEVSEYELDFSGLVNIAKQLKLRVSRPIITIK